MSILFDFNKNSIDLYEPHSTDVNLLDQDSTHQSLFPFWELCNLLMKLEA